MRETLVTDERTNFCARRLPPMPENYSKFLEEVAEETIAVHQRRLQEALPQRGSIMSEFRHVVRQFDVVLGR